MSDDFKLKLLRRANERRVVIEAYKKAVSADFICLVLSEQARIENGELANAAYLAVAIAEGIEERAHEFTEADTYTQERRRIDEAKAAREESPNADR